MKLILHILLILAWNDCAAQKKTNSVLRKEGNEIVCSADKPENPHVEPYLVVHPTNPAHLVIVSGFAMSATDFYSITLNILVSKDKGKVWIRTAPPLMDSLFALDPWLTWRNKDELLLTYLAYNAYVPKSKIRNYISRSTDGGLTWSKPEVVRLDDDRNLDHPVIVTSPNEEWTGVFVVGSHNSISGARLQKGKNSFSPVKRYMPDSLRQGITGAAIFDDGSYVFGSFSMQKPIPGALVAVRSTDGKTYAETIISNKHVPWGWTRFAIDKHSASHKGRVYTAFTVLEDKQYSIRLSFSDDQGATWSKPVVVNSDSTSNLFKGFPIVEISDKGAVAIAWFKTQSSTGNQPVCFEVMAAVSKDGGKSFSEAITVSEKVTCGATPENAVIADRFWYGADYFGLAFASSNELLIAYPGLYQNRYHIMLRKLVVK